MLATALQGLKKLVRFLCAAYLAAFAGLRDSHYDVEQVLLPFVQRHGLLTEREWALLSRRGGFAATGDVARARGPSTRYTSPSSVSVNWWSLKSSRNQPADLCGNQPVCRVHPTILH